MLDRKFLEICFFSLSVSTVSTSIATILSIPIALFLSLYNFFGKRAIISIINALMSLPTVVVGLLVYSFLSRKGLFGEFGLLYTPYAIIIGQVILIIPIITGLLISTFAHLDPRIRKEAFVLGANMWQTAILILKEGKSGVISAIICGFGRVFGEIGISLIVGGNIEGYTRTITTAIAQETSKGEFGLSIALGIILLAISLCLNLIIQYLKR